jgi:hypothetical protein
LGSALFAGDFCLLVLGLLWCFPFTGDLSIDIIQAPICFEQDSAKVLMVLSSTEKSCKAGLRRTIATMDLTSPAEPRAVSKKASNSAVDIRSKPSAILFETESAARSIWLRNPLERPLVQPPTNPKLRRTGAPLAARLANLQIAYN